MSNSLKRILRNELSKHPKYTSQNIINKINGYGYVSFDIFDTLIKRSVAEPVNVFDFLGNDFQDGSFRTQRIIAEKTARERAIAMGREEVRIEEIYSCMNSPYCDDAEYWSKLELKKEASVIYCNQLLKEVFDWCIREGKHVYLISDMYMPADFILKMLNKFGYVGYDKLYLSSELGIKKTTGNLYRRFLVEQGLKAKEVVHIGDSYSGDWRGARHVGINIIPIARNN